MWTMSTANIDLKDNIDLNDIVGNAFADVVNGLIRAKVTMLPNGSIHMGTVNGNINMTGF